MDVLVDQWPKRLQNRPRRLPGAVLVDGNDGSPARVEILSSTFCAGSNQILLETSVATTLLSAYSLL